MSALDWRTEMTTIAEYGDAQVKSANAMGRRRWCSSHYLCVLPNNEIAEVD